MDGEFWLRFAGGVTGSAAGAVLGRMLADCLGVGRLPWPLSIAVALGVIVVSTARQVRHRRRRTAG
jgi:predicted MFS family arabinose efflux permease